MAAALGTNSTVHISADGITYALLGKLKSGSVAVDNVEVDSTTNDDAGYTSALYGNQSVSVSVSCAYDSSDAQQTTLINAAYAKTTLYYRIRPTVGSGLRQVIFQGLATNKTGSFANNSLVELAFSIKSTGTITNSTQ